MCDPKYNCFKDQSLAGTGTTIELNQATRNWKTCFIVFWTHFSFRGGGI